MNEKGREKEQFIVRIQADSFINQRLERRNLKKGRVKIWCERGNKNLLYLREGEQVDWGGLSDKRGEDIDEKKGTRVFSPSTNHRDSMIKGDERWTSKGKGRRK